jgi:Flp pilus assembly protein TadD
MMIKQFSIRTLMLALLTGPALALAGCQTTGTTGMAKTDQVDQALERAATQSSQNGDGRESLAIVEKLYKRNPDDAAIAVRYARALREANRLNRASIIIAPFARDDRNPSAAARTEFSAIQTSLGNYTVAEEYARKALAMNNRSAVAYHMLGIALDAQGDHQNAEDAFRKGLELWEGDPAPILNNLGLNLAAQGFLDEAAEVLRKALATSPNREEIERNLRIVSALRESGGRAPSYMQEARDRKTSGKKPAAAKAGDIKPEQDSGPVPVPSHKPGADGR